MTMLFEYVLEQVSPTRWLKDIIDILSTKVHPVLLAPVAIIVGNNWPNSPVRARLIMQSEAAGYYKYNPCAHWMGESGLV